VNGARALIGVADPERRDRLSAALTTLGYQVWLADDRPALLMQARAGEPRLAFLDQAFVAHADDLWWSELRDVLAAASWVVLPATPRGDLNGDLDATELVSAIEPLLGAALSAPRSARRSPRNGAPLDPFVGDSVAIARLAREAHQALQSESPVLIEGETGTGKGVLAAWLHRHGPRSGRPFVDLNCAGFSRELMDAELFGHEKGAFTGAVTAKPGLLEVAHGGTLFLDEIGDMDVAIQAKLLKVIEEHRYRRVGDTRERQADVRILVATHHHLLDRVYEGRFREDLYYRVSVLPLRMPALRERTGDLSLIARRILGSLAGDRTAKVPALTPDAERALAAHAWPGNLRELRNVLERALLASDRGRIERRHLGLERDGRERVGLGEGPVGTLADLERSYIERVLREEREHVGRAAERLGIPRSTFYQKLRTLGILTPRARVLSLDRRRSG